MKYERSSELSSVSNSSASLASPPSFASCRLQIQPPSPPSDEPLDLLPGCFVQKFHHSVPSSQMNENVFYATYSFLVYKFFRLMIYHYHKKKNSIIFNFVKYISSTNFLYHYIIYIIILKIVRGGAQDTCLRQKQRIPGR